MAIIIKTENEIENIKIAGKIVAETHELLKTMIKPGVTTLELDKAAEDYIRKSGAIPSFKNYPAYNGTSSFPGSICASLNDEIIHGVPNNRKLKDGDLISIDIGACYNGYHADAARTHAVGNASERVLKLIEVTKESFFKSLEFAVEGEHLNKIGETIEGYVTSFGYSVVRDFVGHGVGKDLHEDPQIPHYKQAIRGPKLRAGMVLAIEPMINEGTYEVDILDDGWTIKTEDGLLSAHYENTILITNGKPEILTWLED